MNPIYISIFSHNLKNGRANAKIGSTELQILPTILFYCEEFDL